MFSPQVVIQTSAGTDYAWFWMDRRNLAMSVSTLPGSRLLMALRRRSPVRHGNTVAARNQVPGTPSRPLGVLYRLRTEVAPPTEAPLRFVPTMLGELCLTGGTALQYAELA